MSSFLTEGFSLSNLIVERAKETKCSLFLWAIYWFSCLYFLIFSWCGLLLFFFPWMYCMWIAVDLISSSRVTFLTVLSPFRRTGDGRPVCRDLLAHFEETQDEDQEQTGKKWKGIFGSWILFLEFLVIIFISMLANRLAVFQGWDKRMQLENKLRWIRASEKMSGAFCKLAWIQLASHSFCLYLWQLLDKSRK